MEKFLVSAGIEFLVIDPVSLLCSSFFICVAYRKVFNPIDGTEKRLLENTNSRLDANGKVSETQLLLEATG